jgi:preprotein translocase subunit SecG
MVFLGVLLLVILIISAVLLVVLVLVQDEEGQGIGGIFSGGSTTPFGSRSGNVLTRFTAVLAAIFFAGSLFYAWINRTPESGNVIGAARQQTIQQSEGSLWWVETGSPGTAQPEAVQPPAGTQNSATTPASQAGTGSSGPASSGSAGGSGSQ